MIERKYMSECVSSDYCKGWNDAVVEFTTTRFIPVKCVSVRNSFPGQLIVGEKYRIDKGSLHIDYDGDVFVDVYGFDFKFIAHMNMNHFVGISEV